MHRIRIRRRRMARKVIRFAVLHTLTGAIMLPMAIMILNEVAKVRGGTAVGSEYLFIAVSWYGAYRLIELALG